MKSSVAYSILYHNAQKGIRGLYVTVEQDAAAFLSQMATLGLKPALVSDHLPVLDLGRGRELHEKLAKKLKDWTRSPVERPMTALLKAKVSQLRREFGFELLVIDSWTALILLLEFEDLRRETFDLFEWLRSLGCTTFVIAEEAEGEEGLEEEFLERARAVDVGGAIVPLIDAGDLIIAKILAGRPKDLEDARGLWGLRGRDLDADRIRRTLELLEEALSQSDLLTSFESIQGPGTREN